MDRNQLLGILQRSPLFEGVGADYIETILSAARYKLQSYDKNKIFMLEGMDRLYLDIVVEGRLSAYMVGDTGKQLLMHRMGEGMLVGPAFVFARNHKMPVVVKTDMPSTVMRIRPEDLMQMIDADQRIRHNFITIISNVVTVLTGKIRTYCLLSVREKVVELIRTLSQEQGSRTISLEMSRQDLADGFGIQKFSLTRCLSQLAKEGLISIDGRTITILDEHKLWNI